MPPSPTPPAVAVTLAPRPRGFGAFEATLAFAPHQQAPHEEALVAAGLSCGFALGARSLAEGGRTLTFAEAGTAMALRVQVTERPGETTLQASTIGLPTAGLCGLVAVVGGGGLLGVTAALGIAAAPLGAALLGVGMIGATAGLMEGVRDAERRFHALLSAICIAHGAAVDARTRGSYR